MDKNLEEVRFRVKKGEKIKIKIKEWAALQGKSMSAYIIDLIHKDMDQNK